MTLNHRALGHLVKRGLDLAPSAREQVAQRFANNLGPTKLTTIEIFSLLLTPLCFYVAHILTHYTLFEVLPSLVNIEQPTTVVVSEVRTDTAEPDSPLEKAPLLDEEVVVVRQEPLTNNIRETCRYLRSIGGSRAVYRGFWASVVYTICHALLTHGFLVITAILPTSHLVMTFVCNIAATILLCRLHMTWTHVVISPPSALPWYKRIVRGRHVFKALALPSLKVAVAHQLVIVVPAIAFFAWGSIPEGDALAKDLIFRGLSVIITGLVVAVFVLLPASVHLTRAEASLLPEEVDTVVAFDRTLGGRVTTESKWSARYLAVVASFTAGDRRRIAKYYAKATGMLMMIAILGLLCIGMQVHAFGTERIRATIEDLAQQAQQHGQATINMMKL